MLARLLALLLLAMTLAASAETGAQPPLAAPEPADWKALLCGVLVVAYMARRRSRWLAD